MTTTHPNPHRISIVNPGAYRHIGEFYIGASDEMAEAYAAEHKYLDALGIDWSPSGNVEFHRNGGCAHCGAHFSYGSVYSYRRGRTDEYVAVGHTCAANTFRFDDTITMRAERARKAGDRKRKAAKAAARNAIAFTKLVDGVPGLAEAFKTEHYIIGDIARKGVLWGNLSEKQIALVFKIAKEKAEEAAEKAAAPESSNAPLELPGYVPVTDKRVTIDATLISLSWRDNGYGGSIKMLVEVDGGEGPYRLWGTMPRSLEGTTAEDGEWIDGAVKGDSIRFTARIDRSDDDPSFGFFKRPTKASTIA
jgi:hypothetical protein